LRFHKGIGKSRTLPLTEGGKKKDEGGVVKIYIGPERGTAGKEPRISIFNERGKKGKTKSFPAVKAEGKDVLRGRGGLSIC